jgi:hypothetical protein
VLCWIALDPPRPLKRQIGAQARCTAQSSRGFGIRPSLWCNCPVARKRNEGISFGLRQNVVRNTSANSPKSDSRSLTSYRRRRNSAASRAAVSRDSRGRAHLARRSEKLRSRRIYKQDRREITSAWPIRSFWLPLITVERLTFAPGPAPDGTCRYQGVHQTRSLARDTIACTLVNHALGSFYGRRAVVNDILGY